MQSLGIPKNDAYRACSELGGGNKAYNAKSKKMLCHWGWIYLMACIKNFTEGSEEQH